MVLFSFDAAFHTYTVNQKIRYLFYFLNNCVKSIHLFFIIIGILIP